MLTQKVITFNKLGALALFLLLCPSAAYADDPLNQPLDSVGVSGYDTTLCNDKWNRCSEYDRSQFDSKYPGTSLDSISLYPLEEERPSSNQIYRDSQFYEAREEARQMGRYAGVSDSEDGL